jgi:hypothetical protein
MRHGTTPTPSPSLAILWIRSMCREGTRFCRPAARFHRRRLTGSSRISDRARSEAGTGRRSRSTFEFPGAPTPIQTFRITCLRYLQGTVHVDLDESPVRRPMKIADPGPIEDVRAGPAQDGDIAMGRGGEGVLASKIAPKPPSQFVAVDSSNPCTKEAKGALERDGDRGLSTCGTSGEPDGDASRAVHGRRRGAWKSCVVCNRGEASSVSMSPALESRTVEDSPSGSADAELPTDRRRHAIPSNSANNRRTERRCIG